MRYQAIHFTYTLFQARKFGIIYLVQLLDWLEFLDINIFNAKICMGVKLNILPASFELSKKLLNFDNIYFYYNMQIIKKC